LFDPGFLHATKRVKGKLDSSEVHSGVQYTVLNHWTAMGIISLPNSEHCFEACGGAMRPKVEGKEKGKDFDTSFDVCALTSFMLGTIWLSGKAYVSE